MRDRLFNHKGWRLPDNWAIPIAALVYAGYLSYVVARLLATGLAVRVRMAVIAGWALVLLVCVLVIALRLFKRDKWLSETLHHWFQAIQAWDGRIRGLAYLGLIAIAALLAYTKVSRGLMDDRGFRYAVLLVLMAVAVQFWPFESPGSWIGRFWITAMAFAIALLAGSYFQYVVNYPFSLSWSEANRFYDYSLIFGKYLYQYDGNLSLPYQAPGRYALWGIWFLIPGLPIGFHRFWNAVLWVAPALLLGWLMGRSLRFQPGLRLGLALWLALFLSQGPIYAPILIVAALVVGFDRSRPWMRFLAIAIASLYAGMSRWTWFATAGAWGALLELTVHETEPKRPLIRRLVSAASIFIIGSLPGVLANYTQLFAPKDIAFPLSQPLLWYRLWPNATFEPGIVPGLVLAAGPLLLILIGLIITKRWRLDWLQLASIGGLLLATSGVGLAASVKIGGGSNLHNLDMFLISLGFLVMIYLDQAIRAGTSISSAYAEGNQNAQSTSWPNWAMGIFIAASLLLVWPHFSNIQHVELPDPSDVQRSMDNLQLHIDKYRGKGEILFMDQRQLLTFGTITGVPLIPEYEKKYLMDQSMAGNAFFFKDFYNDLANHRFALIVSEPIFESYDDEFASFGEENNAWVKWVSEPVLCYYEPEKTYKAVRVQLLVPREGSKDCNLDRIP